MIGLLEVTCSGEFRTTPAFAVLRFCPIDYLESKGNRRKSEIQRPAATITAAFWSFFNSRAGVYGDPRYSDMVTSTSTLDKSLYRPYVLNLIKIHSIILQKKLLYLHVNGKIHEPQYGLASC
jgi:hypothetical protein